MMIDGCDALNRLFISRVADFRCCGIASTLGKPSGC
jgi:hypothetical protein